MSDPIRFLTATAQALSTMTLYGDGHPARDRTAGAAYERLRELMSDGVRPSYSFLDSEVIYGGRALREMRGWEWGVRFAGIGVERLEVMDDVTRADFDACLQELFWRFTSGQWSPTEERALPFTSIRLGTVGVRGDGGQLVRDDLPIADVSYTLSEETDAVTWLYDEVQQGKPLPVAEAEAVVSSLSLAMHGDAEILLPLLLLKEYDQYTTTHSINVSVLAMALAEYRGLSARDVRAIGVAGLLHDLGMIRVPKEILVKPEPPTEAEWALIRAHPVEGARLIVASEPQVDVAAVVAYEHHLLANGTGYPALHYARETHYASRLVQICDRYDSLRTRRPFRDLWSPDQALAYVEERAGTEFHADLARSFAQMIRQWDRRTIGVSPTEPVRARVPAPTRESAPPVRAPEAGPLPWEVRRPTPAGMPTLPAAGTDPLTHY